MSKSLLLRRLSMVAVGVALTGCGSVEPVAYTGIASSSYLQPDARDETGRIPLHYSTPVDWRAYSKAMVDPVTIYRGPDNQFGDMPETDKDALAHYMQAQFVEKLASRFQITDQPDARTLRIRLTMTGADTTTPVLGALLHFDIAGGIYNGVQSIRGGEGLLTGWVTYAVEVFDARTHRLLKAYVTKQYPNSMNIGASFGSLAAAETGIKKGAYSLLEQLR